MHRRLPSFLLLVACAVPCALADEESALQAIERLRAAGDIQAAAARASELVRSRPQDLAAHVAYQDLERDLGRDAALESEYRARARAEGATADDLYLWGRLLRGPKAVAQYRAALRLDPSHFPSLCGLGTELTAARDLRGAERVLGQAQAARPGSGIPWNALGRVAEAQGNLAEAESRYRKAVEAAPGLTIARVNLAVVLTASGRSKEALATLAEAAKRAPKDPTPHLAEGVTHLREGRTEEASLAFERALAIDPRSVASLEMVASSYLNLGKLDLAAKALAQAVAIAPKRAATQILLAHLRLAEGRPAEARAAAEGVLAADGENASAHHLVGVAFEREAEPKKAEAALRRALKHEPGNAVFLRTLAQVQARQGRWKDAAKSFQEVVEATHSDPDALYELALAWVGANEPKRAVDAFEMTLAAAPDHTRAWMKLGMLLRDRVRDEKRALKAFREYVARGGTDARVRRWIEALEAK